MVTVTPTNLQKMEFDVTTAEGPSRVTVVTGVIPGGLEVSAGNNFSTQSINLTALLDPTLTPGQFRKATATAALATTSAHADALGFNFQFSIDNVEATLDDESGRIEMRVDGEFGCGIGVAWIMGAKRRHNLFASVAIASVDQNVSNQQPAANPASKIASNVMTSAT